MFEVISKVCTLCEVEKKIYEYALVKSTGHYRNFCKECCKKKAKEYRDKNSLVRKIGRSEYKFNSF